MQARVHRLVQDANDADRIVSDSILDDVPSGFASPHAYAEIVAGFAEKRILGQALHLGRDLLAVDADLSLSPRPTRVA
jgi:hypothetical protein